MSVDQALVQLRACALQDLINRPAPGLPVRVSWPPWALPGQALDAPPRAVPACCADRVAVRCLRRVQALPRRLGASCRRRAREGARGWPAPCWLLDLLVAAAVVAAPL
eukprot:1270773-Pyramimonas_sp.AAC.1